MSPTPHKIIQPSAEQIDRHLDNVLTHAGSGLRHYTMHRSLELMRNAMRDALIEAALIAALTPPAQHPDDAAVDRFASAMKAKLAASRAKGRGGWDDPAQCSVEHLARLLVDHIAKGDPVDVGNFAMMLHQRSAGHEVLAAAQQPAVASEWHNLLAEARSVAYDEEGYIMAPDLAGAVDAVEAMLAAAPAAPAQSGQTAAVAAVIGLNSALHRIKSGNSAGAVDVIEHVRTVLSSTLPSPPAVPEDVGTTPPEQSVDLLERCAKWCDEQARSDWCGRRASDMVRAFAATTKAAQPAVPESADSDEKAQAPTIDIKAAAGRLMGWPLPKDFCPDNGIRFTPPDFGWPTGTNLLNVTQAEQMLAYALGTTAPAVPEDLAREPTTSGWVETSAPPSRLTWPDETPASHELTKMREPLSDHQRGNLVMEHLGPAALADGRMSLLDAFSLGISAAEAAHGIASQAATARAAEKGGE